MKYFYYLFVILIILFSIGFLIWRNYSAPETDIENSDITTGESINEVKNISIMKISSEAFEDNGLIPSRYTCDGAGLNPPLTISDVPSEAGSLVLIMEDPDVPKNLRADGVYDHWIVFNMPTTTKYIAEGEKAPGIYGMSTSGKTKYVSPCPPDREHRYIFSLYAVDENLSLETGATKKEVLEAIVGHIITETKLTGRYNRVK